MNRNTLTALFTLIAAPLAFGQGYEQGPPTNGATAYLSPAEELALFEIQEGYYLELVLSDPDIQEPVDIQFDGNGRMYVVEMRNYMNDADAGNQEAGTGVVSLHVDTNRDGVYDTHTDFATGLVLPRKIMVLDTGVVIGESHTHSLNYYEDTTGDGIADRITPFHDGGARGGNMEHQPNGFVWAIDNWWYSTYNNFRYRYTPDSDTTLTQGPSTAKGQWGITQDLYGKVWPVNGGAERGPESYQHHLLYGPSGTGNTSPDWSIVWPIDNYPDTQGGHKRLRPDNTLNHFTATCGQSIFTGDRLPADMIGDLIFGEPVGRLVRRGRIHEDTNAVVSLSNVYPKSEFIRSTDPNFHIVNSANAPDGTLYLVDMYRGIIQQGSWTRPGSYLRGVIDAYGLGKNVDRGRIWRLRHKDFKRDRTMPKMLGQKASTLIKHLDDPKGWWRMEAQKLIVLSGDTSVVPTLTKMAAKHRDHLARIHALWTLEGLGAMSPEIVSAAAADKHPRVREAATRLSEPFYTVNDTMRELARVLSKDPSALVRKQAGLSMQVGDHPDSPPPVPLKGTSTVYTPAQKKRIAKGKAIYNTLCQTCHGTNAKGFTTSDKLVMGPALTRSPRVTGHPGFSISTVLYGLQGKLDGKAYAAEVMIPMGSNDDEWVASVLSYVRTSFGNNAAPVSPEQVAEIRKRDARKTHWTQAELETRYTKRLGDRKKWTLTASHNAEALVHAIDKRNDSRYGTAAPQKPGMWVAIEFPVTREIGGLSLSNTRRPKNIAKKLKIETSLDGKTWTPVLTQASSASEFNEFLFPQTVKATHLRMTLVEGKPSANWSIHDLQIYGR